MTQAMILALNGSNKGSILSLAIGIKQNRFETIVYTDPSQN